MSAHVTRTDQLRVRLKASERTALETVIKQRGRNETISDVIREALKWLIHPEGTHHPVYVTPSTSAEVKKLANELKRDEGQVVEDCVRGILSAADGHQPLIAKELKLRRKYVRNN